MIDLHSHILPGLCDGAQSLETSLEMARIAVKDGTTHLACTPHIYPGMYNNSTDSIAPALEALQTSLDDHGIPLTLVIGADTHMVPEVMRRLKSGEIPTLNHSKYFLLEPSHHVPVINFLDQIENYLNAGYVPLITHPERLAWVGKHYDEFAEAVKMGAWIQITSGAVSGLFGRQAKTYAERFLVDGLVHVIASDAHGTARRPPVLSEGIEAARKILRDDEELRRITLERPQAVLEDQDVELVSKPPGVLGTNVRKSVEQGWFSSMISRLSL